MASRQQKTLADYLVIAVSPALIMLVVGSLVFFLLEISYRGNYPERVQWSLFWFVFAAVLAARIGIEQGRDHARVYGLALAVVTALTIMRYADSIVLSSVLLLIAWWCADKLTWDCTLIDENEDSSGKGLLDAAPSSASEDDPDAQSAEPGARKETHAPGRTVLYFSLAALPLFGIGQVLIPANNVAVRTYAFRLLWIYLAAALALLLSTSFLGLRRYLRQRRLEMPGSVVRSWIVTGTLLLLLILIGCIFLPRPDADYSVMSIGSLVEAKVREASRFALLKSDPGKGEGRRIGEAKDKAEQENADKPGGEKGAGQPGDGNAQQNGNQNTQKSNDGDGKSAANSADRSGDKGKSPSSKSSSQQKGDQKGSDQSGEKSDDNKDQKADQEPGDGKKNDAQANAQQQQEQNQQAQQPGQKREGAKAAESKQNGGKNDAAPQGQIKPPSTSTDWAGRLGSLAKWLFYALFAIFVVWVLIRYWVQIVDALAQLWSALLALFSGGKKKPATAREESAVEAPTRPPLPFAAFRSPFATGNAERMRVEELVQYTFDALQAWANDRNLGRVPEQTPLEFSRALGTRVPNCSREIDDTMQLYTRVAYSGREIPRSCLPVLEKLWRRMSSE